MKSGVCGKSRCSFVSTFGIPCVFYGLLVWMTTVMPSHTTKTDYFGNSCWITLRLWTLPECCLERSRGHKGATISQASLNGLHRSVTLFCYFSILTSSTLVMSSKELSPLFVGILTRYALFWTRLTKLTPNRFVLPSFLCVSSNMEYALNCVGFVRGCHHCLQIMFVKVGEGISFYGTWLNDKAMTWPSFSENEGLG